MRVISSLKMTDEQTREHAQLWHARVRCRKAMDSEFLAALSRLSSALPRQEHLALAFQILHAHLSGPLLPVHGGYRGSGDVSRQRDADVASFALPLDAASLHSSGPGSEDLQVTVPVQIEKLQIFGSICWVVIRDN